jgi:hypothetical protein
VSKCKNDKIKRKKKRKFSNIQINPVMLSLVWLHLN